MARANAKTRKAKASPLKVNFEGVEASGNVREGRQLAKVKEVELKETEAGNEYLNWVLSAKGGTIYHTTSLQTQALWNLRNMLEAMGMEVPESELELDLAEFVGMEVGVEVEHETYQGKKKPRVIDLFTVEELDGEEDGEEEDGEEEQAEYSDMTLAELKAECKERDIKVPARAKAPALIELLEEDDGEEEEEAESDDLTYADVQSMEKEELLELAAEEEIKVLAKQKRNIKTLRDLICAEMDLLDEDDLKKDEPKESPRTSRRKSGTKTLAKGSVVKFDDDGEVLEGTVMEINTKEGFAVLDVEGEEWEVELEDIKV
jgi:hypothetical protein